MSKRIIPDGRDKEDELDDIDGELRLMLDDYTVEYPGEEAITRTIDALRPYVTHQGAMQQRLAKPAKLPMNRDLVTMLHIRGGFWLVNALFFVCGLYVWGFADGDPYIIMLALAPVPFLIGLLEIFRGRDDGLQELEMSCRYSSGQLMLAKMVVIGGYNVMLSTILIIVFGSYGEPILWTKLLMYWIAPFTVFSSIGFSIACRVRGAVMLPVVLAIWMFVIVGFISSDALLDQMNRLHPAVFAAASVLALVLFARRANRIKRGEYFEIND